MWLRTGLLVLYLQATWAQINELTPITAMPQLISLDVQCEKTGMTVSVQFDRPYNGIIFSKGYYSIPSCQYVEVDSRRSDYTFFIPKEDCGTVTFPDSTNPHTILNFENIIIFQMDPSFQEVWDLARRISCQWIDTYEKRIEFQPFVVDMLDVVSVPFQGDKIECWMDLQIGTFPEIQPINGIVKIGQEMSIIIYIGRNTVDVDVRVKDCYAFDTPNYNDSATKRLQLTDLEGCPVQQKLIDYWKRTFQTGNTGASVIAFTSLNAFKFPDVMDVYITCNIEVCKQRCINRCPGEPTNPVTITHPPITRPPSTKPPITRPPYTRPPITRPPIIQPPFTRPPVTHPPITRPPITRPPYTRPPFTRPPVTRPPITRPPITRPPYTRPPFTRPPVTRPPITRPPITRPPYTRPPFTRPPITRPPITRPPHTRPPITRPPIIQPPFTRPPVTRPPITRPPYTRPPITRPPITRPPITRPPYTRPPFTRPPITHPPITRPPITRPPITRPPITRPPYTRPPFTRPPITHPPITRPPITRPPITRPPITRPPFTRPPVTHPPITRPPITRPPVTRPPITRPPYTRPPITRPPITRPPVTRPPITRPPFTRPPVTRPPITRPPIRPPPTKTSWSGNAPPDHPFHSFHYQPVRPRRFRRYANNNVDKKQLIAPNLPETQVIALRTRSFRLVKEGFLVSNVVRLQGPLYKVS